MAGRDIIPITRLESEASELIRAVSEDGRTLVVTQSGTAIEPAAGDNAGRLR